MSEDSGTPVEIPRAPRPEFLTETRFDDFDLHPDIIAGLDDSGFRACTPIQAQSLPVSLTGKDIAGQAQTGTGKTAAFLVTVFAKLVASKSNAAGMPRCLIVAPTRELAMQVYDDAQMLGRHTKLSIALAIGGIDYQRTGRRHQGPVRISSSPPPPDYRLSETGYFQTSEDRGSGCR